MDRDNRDGLSNDKVYRIRCMKSLLCQVKEDRAECDQLWIRLKKGSSDITEIEELVKVLDRLKQSLNAFRELGKGELEGVLWGEIEEIEKDLMDKENDLRQILFFVSKESEERHLR